MQWIYLLDVDCPIDKKSELGGKGASLLRMARNDFNIPLTACLPTSAYRKFIKDNRIAEKIFLELNRKKFSEMRWEEIWDASLRIRNIFLHASIPDAIAEQVVDLATGRFAEKALAVRSSAPDEDTANRSFAGLHASFLNVRGYEQLLEHIKKVWASLWNDRALLYRQELRLDVESSAMAVVIQEMVWGDSSGIVFSRHPDNNAQMIVESVYGLNQGLVDGEVEPDRWILERKTGQQVIYSCPVGNRQLVTGKDGMTLHNLDGSMKSLPPLSSEEIAAIRILAMKLERLFGTPQDIEWTKKKGKLFLLQSRPITTLANGEKRDKRSWYMSLHRNFDNLLILQKKIEEEHLPTMEADAKRLGTVQLQKLNDCELAEEIEKRLALNSSWVDVYWADCIPFAHGVRLFGEVYNDLMKPEDPFEFVTLLAGSSLLSKKRNSILTELAVLIDKDRHLHEQLKHGQLNKIENHYFLEKINWLQEQFGNPFSMDNEIDQEGFMKMVFPLLEQYGKKKNSIKIKQDGPGLHEFLERFDRQQWPFSGEELVSLARASYRLRDDDNIYLGRIEQQFRRAIAEGRNRVQRRPVELVDMDDVTSIVKALRGEALSHKKAKQKTKEKFVTRKSALRARQLVGQPASKGIARGRSHLVKSAEDLAAFKENEVLVVDAIDPNMTFVAPLASAIIERRGGMLIHGAIIAREYGIPCVTGIPEALHLIKDGMQVTVDGYLGIVTVG